MFVHTFNLILQFYSVMVPVYGVMGVVWAVAMCCSYKDLVRLQFWIFAVIILGFLEKIFFVSEYGSVNTGEECKNGIHKCAFTHSFPP